MSRAATLAALVAAIAPLASPALSGNPTAPTASPGDNDTSIATTEFVANLAAALLASPTFTGDPKAPTAGAADDDTSIATTAHVKDAIEAALAAFSTAPVEVVATWTWTTNVNNVPFTGLGNYTCLIALISGVTSTGLQIATSSNNGSSYGTAVQLCGGFLVTRTAMVFIGGLNKSAVATISSWSGTADDVATSVVASAAAVDNAIKFTTISGNFTSAGKIVLLGLRG